MQREPRVGIDPTSPQDDALFTGFSFPRVHLIQIFFQLSKSEVDSFDCSPQKQFERSRFSLAGPLFFLDSSDLF